MHNKSVIRLFAILLAIVCLYQLSFTYVTSKVRNEAKEYAQGDLQKEIDYLDSISNEVVYDLGIIAYTFNDCQALEINLGLDLKGGMNVTLEISVEDILIALSNDSQDEAFTETISKARVFQESSDDDYLTVFEKAFNEVAPNGSLYAIFNTSIELEGKLKRGMTNEEVLLVLRTETDDAIKSAFNILRTRIDKFGVTQPRIQQLETQGRVLIELPGVKNQERVRNILQSTANLEFWRSYGFDQIETTLVQADNKIKEYIDAQEALNDSETPEANSAIETGEPEQAEQANAEEEEKDLLESLEDKYAEVKDDAVGDLDTTAQNLNEAGTANNPLFALFKGGFNYGQEGPGKSSIVGYVLGKDTAKVNEYLSLEQVRLLFPRDLVFLWSAYPRKDANGIRTDLFELHSIRKDSRGAPVTGDHIADARADYVDNSNQVEVSMNMTSEGVGIWSKLTELNVGRSIAIVLDDYVYSSPVIREKISGNSSITGDFDFSEADDLATMLKSGKLPAKTRIIQEAVVGPSLGKEAISAGLNSFMIAFIVVLAYMFMYYSTSAGSVANIALLANMYFIIGVLASFKASLSLPGIAGIVLTIGMSVDANVLIYERIKEELRAGKGLKLAVADGYKHAYSAIIDANVTTLLTAVILFIFGSGPIRGFATTLMIGIVTSLFSAIFITRLIFLALLDRNKTLRFANKFTENAFQNTKIDFIGKRKMFYILSAAVILIGIGSLVTRGLNEGVDFKGGRTYVIRLDNDVSTSDIQSKLADVYGDAPEVVTFGEANQIRVVTKYKISETGTEIDSEVEELLYQGLQSELVGIDKQSFIDNHLMSSQKVGPTIADDIKTKAVYAIVFALLVMFLYILVRFRNWQFGMGAILALIHDSLIILSLFSLLYGILPFSLEIDQAFIAAILTVVGYSINDTVVVFDRIREVNINFRKRDLSEIMNTALNSTLSRTFSTSISTFLVLLTIFILGGEVIRGFTFALLIGVVVGTYSSLFIASPVVYDTLKNKKNK